MRLAFAPRPSAWSTEIRILGRVLVKPLHGFERKLVQATAATRYIFDDLLAHAGLPKFLEMVGHAGNRLVARIASEEQSDLVRHVNHIGFFHG